MSGDLKPALPGRADPERTLLRTALVSWLTHPPRGRAGVNVGSRAFMALRLGSPCEEPAAGVTDPAELLVAAHASALALILAEMLDSDQTPARELVVSASYELAGSSYEVNAIEFSVQGRVATTDAQRFEATARLAAERCRQSFGLGVGREITIHSSLA
jgi:organic hydroperoxide reductase OsmC/OhrA